MPGSEAMITASLDLLKLQHNFVYFRSQFFEMSHQEKQRSDDDTEETVSHHSVNPLLLLSSTTDKMHLHEQSIINLTAN